MRIVFEEEEKENEKKREHRKLEKERKSAETQYIQKIYSELKKNGTYHQHL